MSDQRSLQDIAADFFMTKYDWRKLSADSFRAALKEAIAWGSTSRWIAIADRLPSEGELVMVYYVCARGVDSNWQIGYYEKTPSSYRWRTAELLYLEAWDVTHWMPLPEPPKD